MKSVISDNVKTIIRSRGLKQGVVASRAGYDYQRFSNMLNNRKLITDVDVANIAKALDVPVSELFRTHGLPNGKEMG